MYVIATRFSTGIWFRSSLVSYDAYTRDLKCVLIFNTCEEANQYMETHRLHMSASYAVELDYVEVIIALES